ncbi:MAG: hypothetical protein BWZ10_02824 [candidate division BRC1 bacterium ADurb.BinA364]|nr:MAG: hypothetical protein BWZ10_02824 [candidate division BRC1 bacterium ADurb.BinA364]
MFGAAAVVGEKQDQRVVEFSQGFEGCDQPPDIPVHSVDHRGVDRHFQIEGLLVRDAFPGRIALVARRQGAGFAIEQPQADHALVSLFAQPIPPAKVAPAIPGDVLGPGVQRIMRRVVGQIEKKGLLLAAVFLQPLDGVVRESVGRVKVRVFWRIRLELLAFDGPAVLLRLHFARRLRLARPGVAGIPEIAGAVEQAEIPVESALDRQAVQMPFAGHQRAIAGRAERFGDCGAIAQGVRADLLGVEARQQRSACRIAFGVVVEAGEAHPALGQAVEVGGFDLAAVAAQVRKPHVIGHDQHDVGPRRRFSAPGKRRARRHGQNTDCKDASVQFHDSNPSRLGMARPRPSMFYVSPKRGAGARRDMGETRAEDRR